MLEPAMIVAPAEVPMTFGAVTAELRSCGAIRVVPAHIGNTTACSEASIRGSSSEMSAHPATTPIATTRNCRCDMARTQSA